MTEMSTGNEDVNVLRLSTMAVSGVGLFKTQNAEPDPVLHVDFLFAGVVNVDSAQK